VKIYNSKTNLLVFKSYLPGIQKLNDSQMPARARRVKTVVLIDEDGNAEATEEVQHPTPWLPKPEKEVPPRLSKREEEKAVANLMTRQIQTLLGVPPPRKELPTVVIEAPPPENEPEDQEEQTGTDDWLAGETLDPEPRNTGWWWLNS
jgi:hypothetical protein